MRTMQALQDVGIDVDGAMDRFMNNEDLFLKFLRRLPQETDFDELMNALAKKDVELAFFHAHRLKSILGNLSLVELYDRIYHIVEVLRHGRLPKDEEIISFKEQYVKMIAYISQI